MNNEPAIRKHDSYKQRSHKLYTLITGASEGIGRSLAHECASRGMHVLLVALPGNDLQLLEDHIQSLYQVSCHSLGIDLAKQGSATEVFEWTKKNNFHINVLINNVGIGSKGLFENMRTDFFYHQVNLNILAGCILTREFMEELKVNAPSYIMNVGSLGGFYCMPEKAVYAATKAFVYIFSKSLRIELKNEGISVSVLCPAGTNTNKSTTASNASLKGLARFTVMQSEEVAKEAIEGMLAKKSRIIPGFMNKCYYHLSRIVPEFVQNVFIEDAFKHVKKHHY
ncbi:MAG: SDR family NAD(P)-dependent oxidoreductase [Bacteroidetes bacterium]|nr:SDR family NAD(P)-dependent oxidoreductase [Bacteroidota bacterium]